MHHLVTPVLTVSTNIIFFKISIKVLIRYNVSTVRHVTAALVDQGYDRGVYNISLR